MMKINDKENKKMLLVNKINMALGILLLAIALLGLFRKPFYLTSVSCWVHLFW